MHTTFTSENINTVPSLGLSSKSVSETSTNFRSARFIKPIISYDYKTGAYATKWQSLYPDLINSYREIGRNVRKSSLLFSDEYCYNTMGGKNSLTASSVSGLVTDAPGYFGPLRAQPKKGTKLKFLKQLELKEQFVFSKKKKILLNDKYFGTKLSTKQHTKDSLFFSEYNKKFTKASSIKPIESSGWNSSRPTPTDNYLSLFYYLHNNKPGMDDLVVNTR